MTIRKYQITYDKMGRAQSKEVPVDPNQKWKPNNAQSHIKRPKIKPPRPPQPKPPKVPGKNRAYLVAKEAFEKGITEPGTIWEMIVSAYNGEKPDSYLKEAHIRCLEIMKGFKK